MARNLEILETVLLEPDRSHITFLYELSSSLLSLALSLYLYLYLSLYICRTYCSVVSDSLQSHGLCSLPGSSVHGIFQTSVLEWVAISFSNVYIYIYIYIYMYIFGCTGPQLWHQRSLVSACGIQFSDQGLNPGPLLHSVLTTGPSGKSVSNSSYHFSETGFRSHFPSFAQAWTSTCVHNPVSFCSTVTCANTTSQTHLPPTMRHVLYFHCLLASSLPVLC